jgi:hypothetical protein
MRKTIFFLLLLALSQSASALGVAIVPDHLVFDGGEESFRIINPNNESITFGAKGKFIDCQPEEGELRAKESIDLVCRAAEGAAGESVILVETMLKNAEESVGVLPAVAVKAEMVGEEYFVGENDNHKESIPEGASQLTIDRGVQEAGEVGEEAERAEKGKNGEGDEKRGKEGEEKGKEEKGGKNGLMKPEIMTIIFLVAAIIVVLVYSEMKERKKGNKENGEKEKEDKKEKQENDETIFLSGSSRDPGQEQDQNSRQGSCPPLCELLEETSAHSQKNMSGSSGSPRN